MTARIITIAAAALVLAAQDAHAQLGWTLDDCLAKWGPQIETPHMNLEAGTIEYLFRAGSDLRVQVDFPGNADSASPDPVEGTVQSIVYLSASRKFLSANIMKLLQANYAGNWQLYNDRRGKVTIHTWKVADQNGNNAAYAIFQRSDNGDGRWTLQVATGYFDAHINRYN